MKALILNSGIGKRLEPFTDENPKCFAEVNGKNLLQRQLEQLSYFGIKDIIITTGHFEGKIRTFVENNFTGLNVTYIRNPKYDSTNYIYSMWLTKHLIDDDILLLHGDMIFDKKFLRDILFSTSDNCVLVNNAMEPPQKDFKAEVINNRVKKIGVKVFGKNAFFLAPIYKFSKEGFNILLQEIDKFVNAGNVNVYAEDAFNNISDSLKLSPVYYGSELCMEIDDKEDLMIARKLFK